MTPEQRHVILHALGLKQRPAALAYRNHYIAQVTPELEDMCKAGWLTSEVFATGWIGANNYRVTKRGLTEAGLTEADLDPITAKEMPA